VTNLRIDDLTNWAALVYVAGVIIGIARTDARWPARLGLALAWPLGPIAFAVTLGILLAASAIAFPLVGAIAGAALLAWFLLS
jgi:hypothetical protein